MPDFSPMSRNHSLRPICAPRNSLGVSFGLCLCAGSR
jgi:hypothetical protein